MGTGVRGLDDDGVAGEEGGGDLADGEDEGEVPWDDACVWVCQ